MKTKTFDCVRMKRQAQQKIRAALAGKSKQQEVAYFREGAEEFKKRIRAARAHVPPRDTDA